MNEDDRCVVLEALADYRCWFDENDKKDLPKIQAIDEAAKSVKALYLPKNRAENIQHAIESLEGLLDFSWNTRKRRFFNSTVLTLKAVMLGCRR